MRPRPRLFALAFGLLLIATMTALWFASRPRHRIRSSTVQEIKPGMTLAEVEETIGVPPGDYLTRRVIFWNMARRAGGLEETWTSNDVCITVVVNSSNRVVHAFEVPVFPIDETWWQQARRWLHLE